MLVVVLVRLVPGLAVGDVDAIQEPGFLECPDRAQNGGEIGAGHLCADPVVKLIQSPEVMA